MPVEFASASGGEPAKEPDFVMIDETGLPARVIGSRERSLLCRSCADLMRGLQDDAGAGGVAQLLKLKDTTVNGRLQESLRVCDAYRMTDSLGDLNSRPQHRIDLLV